MPRPTTCPVCNETTLKDGQIICKACAWQFQTDLIQLASLTPELEAVAAKHASPTPRDIGPTGHQGNAPLPINEKAFDLLHRIQDFATTTILLTDPSHPLQANETTASTLTRLTTIEHPDRLPLAAAFANQCHALADETWGMFVPHETRRFAGYCPDCGARIMAPLSAKAAYCRGCGGLVDLDWLRAHTLRLLRSSTRTFTARELSDWLKDWGLKASKRSIQRWASQGEIVAGPEDKDGRRTYEIGSILNRLKAGGR